LPIDPLPNVFMQTTETLDIIMWLRHQDGDAIMDLKQQMITAFDIELLSDFRRHCNLMLRAHLDPSHLHLVLSR
jgi:hypothetical protein